MRSMLTILCLFASSAHAVPGQFTHQGRLLADDGTPMTGEATITFRVTNEETGGDTLWSETQTVPLTNGFYAAVLGADETENPLDTTVLQQAPVWLELQLDGEPAMFPRSPVHAVPYATISTVAGSVSGGSVNATEIAVDGTPVVDGSGNWVGPAPTVQWDDIEGMPEDFEDGTDDESDSFAALGVSCLDQEIPVWDAVLEAWGCGIDMVLSEGEVDAMVADNGYAMAADVFSGSYDDLTDKPSLFSGSFEDLSDVPGWLSDGDDNDQLSEAEVDAMVADNGFAIAADVDPRISTLLTEIETLKTQYEELKATVEESTESAAGTVMYGDYTVNNTVDLASMEGFTEITGNLNIDGGDIPNLESLASLTRVGGNLYIHSNRGLTDLSGLDNLESVGGYLMIHNNYVLTSLEGLNKIEEVGEYVEISGNGALISLSGLDNLQSVGNGFNVENNLSLTTLDGLNNLAAVGSDIYVHQNDSLTDISALLSLTSFDDDLYIFYNAAVCWSQISELKNHLYMLTEWSGGGYLDHFDYGC